MDLEPPFPPRGRLAGRVAIVWGAGAAGEQLGNGRAAALLYAHEGAAVVCVDRDRAAAATTADRITATGGTALAVTADVTRDDDVQRVVATTAERLGRPDLLHNNVGVAVLGDLPDLAPGQWQRAMELNLGSVYRTCRYTLGQLLDGGGAIVNVSSLAGSRWTGYPYPAYMAAKAGVEQLTVALALRYAARGLRVNAVAPGLIDGPLATALADDPAQRTARDAASPTGASGTPWDVAHAALFLASAEAGYVNGVCLPVDGGLAVRWLVVPEPPG